jgi:hypothetical protein
VLFEARLREGIDRGTITAAFRRWKRPQVVAGRRYRTGTGMIEVESVDVVDPGAIVADDVGRAGYEDVGSLLAGLRGPSELPIYRVRFHRVVGEDPRDVLAAAAELGEADLTELDRRLGRLDRAGAWTARTLVAIEARPGVRAADLARDLGRDDVAAFKVDVRKLKNLGLTLSLEVGYRLSPRGVAYMNARWTTQTTSR